MVTGRPGESPLWLLSSRLGPFYPHNLWSQNPTRDPHIQLTSQQPQRHRLLLSVCLSKTAPNDMNCLQKSLAPSGRRTTLPLTCLPIP